MPDIATAPDAAHRREYKILVNTREKTVHKDTLTFEEVVQLAFDPVPSGPNILITVSFRHAHQKPADGTLTAGGSVDIKNGTVFTVVATDKS
ncbi:MULTISPECIES: multiubiquitin domain-containing protein [unclassified Streptomyces]|uniref:multiubiquitin domain-containing protein n=1 Tax=Streptomyces sp. TP-A0356 TaxID=1359208 RepID=UPI0006E20585|nr:multiubiquitin domain-containing protein [Streptomyces sp. TP-A0356]